MRIDSVARQLLRAEDPDDLFSWDRLVLLLYLVDWKAALGQAGGIDGLSWSVTRTGLTMRSETANGGTIDLLQALDGTVSIGEAEATLARHGPETALDPADHEVVDFVISAGARRPWESLLSLVLATEPLLAAHRDVLDLDGSAADRRAALAHLEPA